MTPYNEILTLHLCGYNNTTIAKMAGCARGTVIDVLKRAKQNNLVYPQECELSDTDIHRILHTPIKRQNEYLDPELGSVLFAIGLPKNSIAKEWRKYVADSESTGRKAYSKSAFQGFIRDMDGKYNLPEYVDGLQITLLKDIPVGNQHVAVLYAEVSYSQWCFAILLPDMKPRSWTNACKRLLHYIGGTPSSLIYVGHMSKSLVEETKSLAEFYGMSIKSERNNVFGRWLSEWISTCADCERPLPAQITEICQKHNEATMFTFSDFDHIDALRIQRKVMRNLPDADYETREVKHPTVQMNFHVELEGKYYSVPFIYRHERFSAEITDSLVELYLDDVLVCVHDRITSEDQKYSTMPEHMPKSDDLIPWGETSGRSLRAWAKHIGFAVFQVVDLLLKRSAFEPQAYKACTSLLSCAKKYGDGKVNDACREALKDKNNRLNLRWITGLIKESSGKEE